MDEPRVPGEADNLLSEDGPGQGEIEETMDLEGNDTADVRETDTDEEDTQEEEEIAKDNTPRVDGKGDAEEMAAKEKESKHPDTLNRTKESTEWRGILEEVMEREVEGAERERDEDRDDEEAVVVIVEEDDEYSQERLAEETIPVAACSPSDAVAFLLIEQTLNGSGGTKVHDSTELGSEVEQSSSDAETSRDTKSVKEEADQSLDRSNVTEETGSATEAKHAQETKDVDEAPDTKVTETTEDAADEKSLDAKDNNSTHELDKNIDKEEIVCNHTQQDGNKGETPDRSHVLNSTSGDGLLLPVPLPPERASSIVAPELKASLQELIQSRAIRMESNAAARRTNSASAANGGNGGTKKKTKKERDKKDEKKEKKREKKLKKKSIKSSKSSSKLLKSGKSKNKDKDKKALASSPLSSPGKDGTPLNSSVEPSTIIETIDLASQKRLSVSLNETSMHLSDTSNVHTSGSPQSDAMVTFTSDKDTRTEDLSVSSADDDRLESERETESESVGGREEDVDEPDTFVDFEEQDKEKSYPTLSVTPNYVVPDPHLAKKYSLFDNAEALATFNANPQKGMRAMIQKNLMSDSPEDVALFLYCCKRLDKSQIGDFLGDHKGLGRDVLDHFVRLFNFTDLDFDIALRRFLSYFRLPGEAQKIDRIMSAFAVQFYSHNKGDIFLCSDAVYILAFAVIMLNTDAHNPNVKKKMTEQEFIRTNRGINDGQDIPHDYLSDIYCRITTNEIKMERESFPDALKMGWVWIKGDTLDERLVRKIATMRIKKKTPKLHWHRLWFILCESGLHFYQDVRLTQPVGTVSLREVKHQVLAEEGDEELRRVRENDKKKLLVTHFMLKLITLHPGATSLGERIFYLALPTQREVDVWLSLLDKSKLLSQAVATYSAPVPPGQISSSSASLPVTATAAQLNSSAPPPPVPSSESSPRSGMACAGSPSPPGHGKSRMTPPSGSPSMSPTSSPRSVSPSPSPSRSLVIEESANDSSPSAAVPTAQHSHKLSAQQLSPSPSYHMRPPVPSLMLATPNVHAPPTSSLTRFLALPANTSSGSASVAVPAPPAPGSSSTSDPAASLSLPRDTMDSVSTQPETGACTSSSSASPSASSSAATAPSGGQRGVGIYSPVPPPPGLWPKQVSPRHQPLPPPLAGRAVGRVGYHPPPPIMSGGQLYSFSGGSSPSQGSSPIHHHPPHQHSYHRLGSPVPAPPMPPPEQRPLPRRVIRLKTNTSIVPPSIFDL